MVEFDRTLEREPVASSRLKICVVGIGGGGLNILDRLSLDRLMDASIVAMHSDVRVLSHSMAANKIQLGADLMRGIGCGGDPELGKEAAFTSRDQIRTMLEGHNMVFVCCGLGGGTGSGAAPVVVDIAKQLGCMVFVFATVPFSFEGRRRLRQSELATRQLQEKADALILFENNRMGELVLPKEGIQKAFSQADQLIGHSVRAISTLVTQPGIVRMGIADLMSALNSPNARCLFGFGEARGNSRVSEALKRALKSPLVNQGQLLQNARNLLVHVAGGESLTLAEVESLMKQLGKYVPENTHIMFGLAVDQRMGDTISVTLISSLSAGVEDEEGLDEESPELEVTAEEVDTFDTQQELDGDDGTPDLPFDTDVTATVAAPASQPVMEEAEPVIEQPKVEPVAVVTPPPAVVAKVEKPVKEPVQQKVEEKVQPAAPASTVTVRVPVEAKPVQSAVSAVANTVDLGDLHDLFAVDSKPAAAAPVTHEAPVVKQEPVAEIKQTTVVADVPVQAQESLLMEADEAVVNETPVQQPQVRIIISRNEETTIQAKESAAPAAIEAKETAGQPPTMVRSIFSVVDEEDEDGDDEEEYDDSEVDDVKSSVDSEEDNDTHWAEKYMQSTPAQPQVPVQAEKPRAKEQPTLATAHAGAAVKDSQATQSTFNLNQDDIGRFKGTSKNIVEGEDLDVPTWMRMRQKTKSMAK